MDRELMVRQLVDDQAERIRRGWCELWLLRVLEEGFPGYGNLSAEELANELRSRGLTSEYESPKPPPDGDDDGAFDDEEDIRLHFFPPRERAG